MTPLSPTFTITHRSMRDTPVFFGSSILSFSSPISPHPYILSRSTRTQSISSSPRFVCCNSFHLGIWQGHSWFNWAYLFFCCFPFPTRQFHLPTFSLLGSLYNNCRDPSFRTATNFLFPSFPSPSSLLFFCPHYWLNVLRNRFLPRIPFFLDVQLSFAGLHVGSVFLSSKEDFKTGHPSQNVIGRLLNSFRVMMIDLFFLSFIITEW